MSTGRQSLVCLTTSAAFGGAETSLLTLLGALRRLEPSWRMTVIVPTSGPLIDACLAMNVDVRVLPFPGALAALGESGATGARRRSVNQLQLVAHAARAAFAVPSYVASLRRALRELNASVVHSNGLKAHVAAALAKPAGVRLVWHIHEYVQPRPLTARLLKMLIGRADVLVTNSDSVLDDVRAVFPGSARVHRVYNAVDLSAFTDEGPALDLARLSGLGPDAGFVRVGLVATFGRWKGHDVFIDAIARLQHRREVRAYVIGGPVYATSGSQWSLAELRSRVAARGLDGTLGFTGHIADTSPAFRSLDIVVHASTQPEPFGMVIAEGMASGRSVVAVNAGGARELFEPGVNAMGFAIGDADGLAAAIDELVGDEKRRVALGVAARAAAHRRFSPDRMAAEFREVYLG
jgi:glycosyltransferase involved in cell wall biosynthesis